MDTEKLILLIQSHRELYDSNHRNHRNREAINATWRKIAEEMNSSEIICKDKWHIVRSNFMRKRRTYKGSSGINPTRPKWRYTDLMSFLIPYVEHKPSRRGVARSEIGDCVVYERSESFDEHTSDEQKFVLENDGNSPLVKCKVEMQSDNESYENPSIPDTPPNPQESIRKLISPKRKSNCEMNSIPVPNRPWEMDIDSDHMFLLSLLPMIRQLSPRDNLNYRVEVQELLRKKLFPENHVYHI